MSETVTWLICGGRDFDEQGGSWPILVTTLDALTNDRGAPALVIHGNAPGADTLGGEWAYARGIKQNLFSADWIRHGRAAGPIRNQRMIDDGKPDLVIAFPGGRGTADMVRRARAAGVEVVEVAPGGMEGE